ncbi:MAG: extracellular solute-binding protein [Treponema sp.]|nr:extracellular solute-binding protein [Treponema sp.]
MKKRIAAMLIIGVFATAIVWSSGGQSSGNMSGQGSSAGSQVANMNPTGYPIAIQPATLRVAVQKRPQHNRSVADFAYFAELQKKTNVNIDWVEWDSASIDEKRQLAFATNQLPDVLLCGVTNMVNYYGNQKLLTPLNDLISKYAPDIQAALKAYPDTVSMMTNPDDGKWYAMVYIQDPMYTTISGIDLYINKKWLDNLGLKVPETITDFHNALLAFKNRDANGNGNPNDEIPFSFCYQEGAPEYSYLGLYIMFFPFGVAEYNNHMMVVNGKLQHTFTMPAFRDGVRFLGDMYKEGLIDPESFSYNRQQYFAACQSKEVGAGIAYAVANNFGRQKEPDYVPLFLKGPNGEDPVIFRSQGSGDPGSGPAIAASFKIPEIAIRWINELYKPEMAAQIIHGEVGKYIIPSTDPQYLYQFSAIPQGVSEDEYRFTISNALGTPLYAPKNYVPISSFNIGKKQIDAIKEPYFVKDPLPNFVFNDAELNEIQPMKTELNTFAMNTLANWIVKGTVDAEWDQVQQQLNRMGLPRYMEIYQKVYDRMMASR